MQQPPDIDETGKVVALNLKLNAVVILEMLKLLNSGKAYNDLTKISRLISRLTGYSSKNIRNLIQKGIVFTDFHAEQIEEINKILTKLNLPISIKQNTVY